MVTTLIPIVNEQTGLGLVYQTTIHGDHILFALPVMKMQAAGAHSGGVYQMPGEHDDETVYLPS